MLQLGQSSSYKQQHAGEKLQAVGNPDQIKGPAERGVNIGQTLWPYQPLSLSQELVRVDNVETDTTQSQQTWREMSHTHIERNSLNWFQTVKKAEKLSSLALGNDVLEIQVNGHVCA